MELPKEINAKIALLGIPFDGNSSYSRGASKGPDAIRRALNCESSNLSTESLIDLSAEGLFFDAGNLEVSKFPDDIIHGVDRIMTKGLIPVTLGGDHSITYPIIKAIASHIPHLTILHLDAHGDLYDEFQGSRYSHACPFARIMEEKLASRLIQVGIRTLTAHQRNQAERFGVEIIEMKDLHTASLPPLESPLYLSLDIDVLDPAFAPGISHYEPGGMSTREVLNIIQSIKPKLIGADIVELNPDKDIQDITAMAAAKFLKEILDNLLRPEPGQA